MIINKYNQTTKETDKILDDILSEAFEKIREQLSPSEKEIMIVGHRAIICINYFVSLEETRLRSRRMMARDLAKQDAEDKEGEQK